MASGVSDARGSSFVQPVTRRPATRRGTTERTPPVCVTPPDATSGPERRHRRTGTSRARRPRACRAACRPRPPAWCRPSADFTHSGLEPVLGDHDVAVEAGDGVEDAEVGRVGEPGALAGHGGVLGDLEAEVVPAAQRGRDGSGRADVPAPGELRAVAAGGRGLRGPVEVHGSAEDSAEGPLDVRAQRGRRRVDVEHAPGRDASGHASLLVIRHRADAFPGGLSGSEARPMWLSDPLWNTFGPETTQTPQFPAVPLVS